MVYATRQLVHDAERPVGRVVVRRYADRGDDDGPFDVQRLGDTSWIFGAFSPGDHELRAVVTYVNGTTSDLVRSYTN